MKKATDKQILQNARDMIAAGKTTEFICIAIICSQVGTEFQRKRLTNWISKMLDGCARYDYWLQKHHPERFIAPGRYREARLQWLDWMIENCDATKPAGQ